MGEREEEEEKEEENEDEDEDEEDEVEDVSPLGIDLARRGTELLPSCISPPSYPREHYPTIGHTRTLQRNPSLESHARIRSYTSSSGIPFREATLHDDGVSWPMAEDERRDWR